MFRHQQVLHLSPPPTAFPTNTRPAPNIFPTTTPLPATFTPTATEGPCIKTASAGDTIYGLAQQCGHRHFSIVDVILEVNSDLNCETCLLEGQSIEIPWPTSTPGLPEESGQTEDDEVGAVPQTDESQPANNNGGGFCQ